ncbi:MAG: M23 family metallopeptidase [Bacteroidetes bacterium]|nr:M23 family metallopeptidase [Bacteroidota bacterium]
MRKEKYFYNTRTLRYEKIVETLGTKALRIFGFVCSALFTAFIFTLIAHTYLPSPKEKALERELDQMRLHYANVNTEIEKMGKILGNIQERDAHAHRMVFGMDPIDQSVWKGGVGGHEKYNDLASFPNAGQTLVNAQQKVDQLKRQLTVQSKSLDTILTLASEKETMLASIPSIKPVRSDKLKRNMNYLSGYGFRPHPIHKVRKMHWGIDFTSPTGTAIQSTGDGKIIRVETRKSGYGQNVMIDHGFGYKTLYAHMSRVDVHLGEKVKKGQKIGLVGSTGTSTAPHCHYEIIYKGKKINPIHYCMDGLSPDEYEELVKAASVVNQSFD